MICTGEREISQVSWRLNGRVGLTVQKLFVLITLRYNSVFSSVKWGWKCCAILGVSEQQHPTWATDGAEKPFWCCRPVQKRLRRTCMWLITWREWSSNWSKFHQGIVVSSDSSSKSPHGFSQIKTNKIDDCSNTIQHLNESLRVMHNIMCNTILHERCDTILKKTVSFQEWNVQS